MEGLIRAVVIGMAASIVGLVIKKGSGEAALLLTLAVSALILALALGTLGGLFDFLYELAETTGLSGAALSAVLKTVGIGVVTKYSSDVCRDAGQGATASAIDMAGAAAALTAALPLLKTVFAMIRKLV